MATRCPRRHHRPRRDRLRRRGAELGTGRGVGRPAAVRGARQRPGVRSAGQRRRGWHGHRRLHLADDRLRGRTRHRHEARLGSLLGAQRQHGRRRHRRDGLRGRRRRPGGRADQGPATRRRGRRGHDGRPDPRQHRLRGRRLRRRPGRSVVPHLGRRRPDAAAVQPARHARRLHQQPVELPGRPVGVRRGPSRTQ